jgi:hypothetical protein
MLQFLNFLFRISPVDFGPSDFFLFISKKELFNRTKGPTTTEAHLDAIRPNTRKFESTRSKGPTRPSTGSILFASV